MLVCIAAAILLPAVIYYYLSQPLEMISVDMDAEIKAGNKVGLNADRDALHFGMLAPGNSGARIINTTNNRDIPVIVQIYTGGNISVWVHVEDNSYTLQPGETKMVKVGLTVPYNAKPGNYTGILVGVFKRKLW